MPRRKARKTPVKPRAATAVEPVDEREFYNGHDYKFCSDIGEWKDIVAQIKESGNVAGSDVETSGLDPYHDQLHGFSLSWAPGVARYMKWEGFIEKHRERFTEDLTAIQHIPHNGMFEKHWWHRYLPEMTMNIEMDTLIAAFLLDPDAKAKKLKRLSDVVLNVRQMEFHDMLGMTAKELKASTQLPSFDLIAPPIFLQYACGDSDLSKQIRDRLAPKLRPQFENQEQIDIKLIDVLVDMERAGMEVNHKYLEAAVPMYERALIRMQAKLFQAAGHPFDINSPQKVGVVLFQEMGLTPYRLTKKKKQPSTAAKDLEKMAVQMPDNPFLQWVVKYKQIQHSLSLYVNGSLKGSTSGVCRADYILTEAPTYRLAAAAGKLDKGGTIVQQMPKKPEWLEVELAEHEEENLKNLGFMVRDQDADRNKLSDGVREVAFLARKAFVARKDHYYVSADYAAVEFRIMINLSGQTDVGRAIRAGRDPHKFVASMMFNIPEEQVDKDLRESVKAINYGLLYGMQAWSLKERLNVSEERAKHLYSLYFKTLPFVDRYIKDRQRFARRYGYVTTYWGRRRFIRDYQNVAVWGKRAKARGDRSAVNTIIQGSGADIMRIALVRAHFYMKDKYGDKVKLVLTMHDQIMFEVHNSVDKFEFGKDVKLTMEMDPKAWASGCPITVDITFGPTWADQESLYKKVKEAETAKDFLMRCAQQLPESDLEGLFEEIEAMVRPGRGDVDVLVLDTSGQIVLKKFPSCTVNSDVSQKLIEVLSGDLQDFRFAERN